MQDTATTPRREDFTMDPNLLVSVLRSQAGTLSKALLEGVMNSIDAGATRVDVTLTSESFTIEDNGKGFTNEDEIRAWFGRFGTPHQEGDATYGRFRMGRGQMFSYAASTWTSHQFRMSVDINRLGLTYELARAEVPFRGCRIEAQLYNRLSEYELNETLQELKKFVAFTPRPVYVNGQLFGASPARLKSWTAETDDAWYRLNQDSEELLVYNQGVFVCAYPTWKVGMGGVLVSKHRLEVNFARNAVMENDCPVWKRIRAHLEALVFAKLARASKLADGERAFLARRVRLVGTSALGQELLKAKILTDPSGKHYPLETLRSVKTLVYAPKATTGACQLQSATTFVVTDKLIDRFGAYSFEDFLDRLKQVGGLLAPDFEVLDAAEAMKDGNVGATELLESSGLRRKQQAALTALTLLNEAIGRQLQAAGLVNSVRTLLVARQKKESAIAWTDGRAFITANVKHLKDFEEGLDGVHRWVYTLVHEYCHDTDDSESHDHSEVFYRKFHDVLFDKAMHFGDLAQQGLAAYLRALNDLGLPKPHRLSRQLRIRIN